MRYAVVLAAAALAAACARAPGPAPAPPPPIEPVVTVEPAQAPDSVFVCVIRNGDLAVVGAELDPATGDTLVGGRRFAEAFPVTDEYAPTRRWYVDNEPLPFYEGRRPWYVKYGLPRFLAINEILRVGEHDGISVFGEISDPYEDSRSVLYVPTSPGCFFQPYQFSGPGEGVRGAR